MGVSAFLSVLICLAIGPATYHVTYPANKIRIPLDGVTGPTYPFAVYAQVNKFSTGGASRSLPLK